MFGILFKIFVYSVYTLYGIALNFLIYESATSNTIDKELLNGCHFALVCEECYMCSLPRCERSEAVLCWNNSKLTP